MTYRELLEELQKLTQSQLDLTVKVETSDNELYPVSTYSAELLISDHDDIPHPDGYPVIFVD